MYYVHKKAKRKPKVATFRTKTLHFFRVIRLNWQAKMELRGPGPLVFNIVVSYYCKRKMLRNRRLFCLIFDHGEIAMGGALGLCSYAPIMKRLSSNKGKEKRYLQIFREVSGVFQQNFNCSKNSAVLEPRTGQFSRT